MNHIPLFVTAGLDLRIWPPAKFPSADVTAWDQDEDLYERAKSEIGFYENPLQLLACDNESEFYKLVDLVSPQSQSVIVALELTEITLVSY